MKYISTNLYRKMIDCARLEGIDEAAFKKLPTSLESIQQLQAVPADHFFELHELLDEKLGPGFAVRVGQQMKIEDYGVLGLSWRTCSWAGEIFDRCERYFHLLSNTYVFKVEKKADNSFIYLNRHAYRPGIAFSNEATISATVVVLQYMTETDIRPVQVAFKHKAPSNLSSHHSAFLCPVHFEQDHNYIAYATQDLERRTAKADASINRFLVERVEEETRGIEVHPNQITADVAALIKDALPSGIPSISQVGEHIGMSNRTLTRRLSENGLSFRDIIQKTQEQVAKDLLHNTLRSVAEIAFETGFSEQSAFNRAFKRWTGVSPLEFRNQ